MKKATSILVPLLALALTCLYPCAFQYFRNADEAAPGDMVPLLLIFLAMGAAVLLLSLMESRRQSIDDTKSPWHWRFRLIGGAGFPRRPCGTSF